MPFPPQGVVATSGTATALAAGGTIGASAVFTGPLLPAAADQDLGSLTLPVDVFSDAVTSSTGSGLTITATASDLTLAAAAGAVLPGAANLGLGNATVPWDAFARYLEIVPAALPAAHASNPRVFAISDDLAIVPGSGATGGLRIYDPDATTNFSRFHQDAANTVFTPQSGGALVPAAAGDALGSATLDFALFARSITPKSDQDLTIALAAGKIVKIGVGGVGFALRRHASIADICQLRRYDDSFAGQLDLGTLVINSSGTGLDWGALSHVYNGFAIANNFGVVWSSTTSYSGTADASLYRVAAGVIGLGSGAMSGGSALSFGEVTAPSAVADRGTVFAVDESGTTALRCIFGTNSVRVAKDIAPVTITQTYATTAATHAAMTWVTIGAFTGGLVGFLDAAERDNLRTQINALAADVINVKGVLNLFLDAYQAAQSVVN